MKKKQAIIEEKNTEIKNQILGQAVLNEQIQKIRHGEFIEKAKTLAKIR